MRSPTEWPTTKATLSRQVITRADRDHRPLGSWSLVAIVALSFLGAWVVAEMAKVLA